MFLCACVRACMSAGRKDAVECGTGRKQPSKGLDDVASAFLPARDLWGARGHLETKMPPTVLRSRLRCAWNDERSCAARCPSLRRSTTAECLSHMHWRTPAHVVYLISSNRCWSSQSSLRSSMRRLRHCKIGKHLKSHPSNTARLYPTLLALAIEAHCFYWLRLTCSATSVMPR
jgi:hypothetical protein